MELHAALSCPAQCPDAAQVKSVPEAVRLALASFRMLRPVVTSSQMMVRPQRKSGIEGCTGMSFFLVRRRRRA